MLPLLQPTVACFVILVSQNSAYCLQYDFSPVEVALVACLLLVVWLTSLTDGCCAHCFSFETGDASDICTYIPLWFATDLVDGMMHGNWKNEACTCAHVPHNFQQINAQRALSLSYRLHGDSNSLTREIVESSQWYCVTSMCAICWSSRCFSVTFGA